MVGLDIILKILTFSNNILILIGSLCLIMGYNIRISEPQAALGLEQLKKLKSFIKIRRKLQAFSQNSSMNMMITFLL